jgi:Cu(I)/Ag(I) efflux system membrane fusion protein
MELTPVYEGDKGFDAKGDVISLSQSQVQVLNVQTSEAKVQPLTHGLHVAGMIDDDDTRHRVLSAYVDGRIEKLHVNYVGAVVTEGQPLAEIYSPTLLAMEREYSSLLRSQSSDKILLDGARLKLQRMGLTAAQIAALAKTSPEASTSEILAPMSGTVVGKEIYEGQYVAMGAKLFDVGDFTTMWFQFRAYEQDIPWIKTGQTVEVTTPSVPGRVFTGTVKFLDPNFDETTRSTKVRVELPNVMEDGRCLLLHRLYADGVVHVSAPEVLAVPRAAVIQAGPEAVVYLDQGSGSYTCQPVKIGRRGDALIEIISGIKAGDHVVTNGNLLMDGQAEMNRAFAPSQPPPPEPSSAPAPPLAGTPLTEDQGKAAALFVKVADAMAAALSDEKVAAFNEAARPAEAATHALADTLRARDGFAAKLGALEDAAHFHAAADLNQARVAFHKFTMAAIPVMEPLRTAQGAPEFKVWECFMVNSAIEGAPKFGRWVQVAGRPGHNPFLGPDMLECVKEIPPGGKVP